MYTLFFMLFSLLSMPINAQHWDKSFSENIEKSEFLKAMRVADAPSQTPREDSFLLAAHSYGTERDNLKEEADIYEIKDPQTNFAEALFVEFKDDSNIVYLAFPGVRGISAEQG